MKFSAFSSFLATKINNEQRPYQTIFLSGCEYMKVIYLNCGWRRRYESDLSSNEHYLSSSEKKARKKFRPVRDLNPWPLRYRCSASAVQIYDFRILTAVYSLLHGFIWNQHSDRLPVRLLTQLVEHCSDIASIITLFLHLKA